jgi:hypothetical protein
MGRGDDGAWISVANPLIRNCLFVSHLGTGSVPALQVGSLEFKPQSHKEKKRILSNLECLQRRNIK